MKGKTFFLYLSIMLLPSVFIITIICLIGQQITSHFHITGTVQLLHMCSRALRFLMLFYITGTILSLYECKQTLSIKAKDSRQLVTQVPFSNNFYPCFITGSYSPPRSLHFN